MKTILLVALLTICYSGHAQAIKFVPPAEDWRATATPQQMADTLRALEVRQEKAQQRANLLRNLADIAADRADDSIKRLRAAQIKEWSKVPKSAKNTPTKKKTPSK